MSARAQIDANGVVVNIIEADASVLSWAGLLVVSGANAAIGHTYDPISKMFTAPAPPPKSADQTAAENLAALNGQIAALKIKQADTVVAAVLTGDKTALAEIAQQITALQAQLK